MNSLSASPIETLDVTGLGSLIEKFINCLPRFFHVALACRNLITEILLFQLNIPIVDLVADQPYMNPLEIGIFFWKQLFLIYP